MLLRRFTMRVIHISPSYSRSLVSSSIAEGLGAEEITGKNMTAIFATISVIAYITASFVLMGRLFDKQGPNKLLAMMLGTLGAVSHILFLTQSILVEPGQNMSITNVLSLVSCIIAVSMLVSATLLPNILLLPAVFGFAALGIVAAWLIPVSYIMQINLQPSLLVHITLSLFAYGTLVMAFLYAIQMSFITYKLKHKGVGLLHSSLPPLMLVEQILFKLIVVGTILLMVSLATGFIFLDNMFSAQYAHKTVFSLGALGLYAVLLVGQKVWGWRGRQVVMLTVSGVVLLTLAYFGSRFVREILL